LTKLRSIIVCTALSALILSSCTKNEGLNNTDNTPVNYDALYVVNSSGNSLSVVNLTTFNVEKTINLGTMSQMMSGGMMNGGSAGYNMWPYHISISPDKSKLAITEPGMDFNGAYEMMKVTTSSGNMGGMQYQHHNSNSSAVISDIMQMQGKLLILDAITGDLLKEIGVEGMPYDAIFSPNGKELWTSLMMPVGKVKVFDTDSYSLLNTITAGNMPAGIAFSDDGNKVFIASVMSGSVIVFDALTKMPIDSIRTGQGTVGTYPGMHAMMYADNEKDQAISIINQMNDMMTDSIHLGFTPGMIIRNSMMNQLWVSDPADGKIHFWTQTGTGYMPGGSITVGSGAGSMIFSQTGDTCYVANKNDNSISMVDVGMLKELKKIPVGEKPNSLIIRYK
jgi:YVTN family beta-propeller protein